MLGIPTIRTPIMIGEGSFEPLQGHIRTAHDSLPHVIEAMDHVPVVVIRDRMIGLEA